MMEAGFKFDFQVIGAPRSGTMWMANFLSFGSDCLCVHEPESTDGEYLDELEGAAGIVGASSSGLVQSGMFNSAAPTVRIRRPFGEAWEAYERFTNLVPKGIFAAIYDEIMEAGANEMLDIPFKRLTERDTCMRIWEFLFEDAPFPAHHYSEKSRMRITTMDTAIDRIRIMERRIS